MKLIPISFILFLCSLMCLSGCGKPANPEGRLDVSGLITYNGGSFEGATMCTIAFEPLSDKSAGSSSAPILESGKFLCTMHDGLKPGKYRVKFYAQALYDKRTKTPIGPDFGNKEGDEAYRYIVNFLPPEFNENSTVEFEVVAGKKNVFDYNIETSYVPTP